MNIYYCKHCKRICYTYPVDSTLVCCGDEMTLLEPKTTDQGNEKHLPVVERIAKDKIKISIGSVMHPMLPEHFIQWVFVAQDDTYQIKTFKPGEAPEVVMNIIPGQDIKVYEFCNIHGLWMTEVKK
ncbi:MAG: desulfoferrodoxin [Bacilli bacterium]|nr:desulfoferrodoxin [Bacilli bacterium]MBN2696050.1 desulfoferrodoxin [Bacilli bacterium]